ncbi:MAG: hypothetical protein FJ102_00210 [Deltaproteobacteria bacterium]|nr:hypothetical protein [Deltaproteobacteria bacterium]
MMIVLAGLWGCTACVTLPAEVPNAPGTVDEDVLPDLLSVSSPDLPMNLWFTIAQLSYEDYRDCPIVTVTDQVLSIVTDADGCLDSSGVHWVGSATATFGAGGAIVFSFDDFGPDSGADDAWTAFGTVTVTRTTSGLGDRVHSDLQMTSISENADGNRVFYHSTDGSLTYYDGAAYFDHFYGTVGLGDWGTAQIDANRVPLATVNGCAYAKHYAGTIGVFAANEAVFSFKALESEAKAPPPAEGSDSGNWDTGDADTDTDTDTDSDSDLDVSPPSGDAEGLCGDCAAVSVDGTTLPECVEAERTVGWPFYIPF